MSTGTLRQSYWAIAINGSPYIITGGGPAQVLDLTVTAGFDQQVIEATITVETDDGAPSIGDWVQINMGATEATGALRFAGYFMEYDYTLYPRQVGLICRSPLVRAKNFANPAANGTDLSASGAGQTDIEIVQQILTACGLTGDSHYTVATPGGLGRILGKKATQYYTWSEGDDGLSAIQLVDEICQGYRTFDKIDRIGSVPTIVREQVSIIPSGSPSVTFNQGDDILEATNQISILDSRNIFLVTGYNPSTVLANATSATYDGTGGGPPLPWPAQWSYASSLIEYAHEADRPSGEGVSCEEIAGWANGQYNRLILKTPFTTQRDDIVDPGDLIAVIATKARIGADLGSSLFWVQSVTNQIDKAGAYSQKFVCVQGA